MSPTRGPAFPPQAVAVADVASPAGAPDGLPDRLIGTDDGALVVFLGIGDGTFALASLSIAPAAHGIRVAAVIPLLPRQAAA